MAAGYSSQFPPSADFALLTTLATGASADVIVNFGSGLTASGTAVSGVSFGIARALEFKTVVNYAAPSTSGVTGTMFLSADGVVFSGVSKAPSPVIMTLASGVPVVNQFIYSVKDDPYRYDGGVIAGLRFHLVNNDTQTATVACQVSSQFNVGR